MFLDLDGSNCGWCSHPSPRMIGQPSVKLIMEQLKDVIFERRMLHDEGVLIIEKQERCFRQGRMQCWRSRKLEVRLPVCPCNLI